MWANYRRIQGRTRTTRIQAITSKNGLVTEDVEIAEALCNAFSTVSSDNTYSNAFLNYKQQVESHPLNIPDTDDAAYNQNYTLNELEVALEGLKGSSPGEDGIHYAMITHLPRDCKQLLLITYNKLWKESVYPQAWTKSIVVPIFKGKGERINPKNYRPIYLNSVGKIFERMINSRLSHILETRKILYQHQCAFRKGKSTVDYLIQIEKILLDAVNKKNYAQAIFLDIAKAYDTTWRRLVLNKLGTWNIGGRMLRFLARSLEKRTFKVATNGVQSDEQEMKTGLCQGSVLSVTLFLIAINTIVDCLPEGIHCFIYADDVVLVAEGRSHAEVETKLQRALNAISQWQNETGFKISAEKSSTVVFKHAAARKVHRNTLTMEGELIARNKTHKCLGVTIDQSLLFHKHVEEIASTCKQRLQFLRYVANTSWGGDRATISKLYKATILEKMLYAAPVVSAIRKSALRKLDTIHHTGLRAISGAFYTSPIASLHAESGIPELQVLLQQRTAMQSAKLLANESSTGTSESSEHDKTLNTSEEDFSMDNSNSSGELWGKTQTNYRESAIVRGNQLLEQIGMQLPGLSAFSLPKCAPWEQKVVLIDKSLHHETKRTCSSRVLQQLFKKLKSTRYRYHQTLFTDGSRKDGKSGFSVVGENVIIRRRIDDMSSIYTAESEAIKEATTWVTNQDGAGFYLICTDSLSAISELEKKKITSKWRDDMAVLLNRCSQTGKQIDYCWIPSHIGIPGNEAADREAKASLEGNIDRTRTLNYKEVQTNIKNQFNLLWQQQWSSIRNNKLREIKNTVTPYSATRMTRRENVIITRLRIGHTKLTHKYLLEKNEVPKCRRCNAILTIKHIIVDCPALDDDRKETGMPPNMREALADDEEINNTVLAFFKKTEYIKEI